MNQDKIQKAIDKFVTQSGVLVNAMRKEGAIPKSFQTEHTTVNGEKYLLKFFIEKVEITTNQKTNDGAERD